MEIVSVKNLEEASIQALIKISKKKSEVDNLKIAIPGGRFGVKLFEKAYQLKIDISSWRVFFTDERISEKESHSIKKVMLSKACNLKGFKETF